ncbi:hypothetical protein F4814DRAFT_446631 [Daldinia grandis]|nr:hypothetical protein F4814DRAFT_446631 [Daldinia grandis]
MFLVAPNSYGSTVIATPPSVRDLPPSPVSADLCCQGLPLFNLSEEPNTTAGNFDAVKNVDEMDRSHRIGYSQRHIDISMLHQPRRA